MTERTTQKIAKQVTAQNTEVFIDVDTDKSYDRVTELLIYTDKDYASNKNLQMVQPLKIDGIEILPKDFDTFLMFPKKAYDDYRKKSFPVRAKGSRIEGSFKDPNTFSSTYYVYFILVLERDVPDMKK